MVFNAVVVSSEGGSVGWKAPDGCVGPAALRPMNVSVSGVAHALLVREEDGCHSVCRVLADAPLTVHSACEGGGFGLV